MHTGRPLLCQQQPASHAQATRQRMSRARLMRRFHTSGGSTEVMGSDLSKLSPSLQSVAEGADAGGK